MDGGWAFCREHAARAVGRQPADARAVLVPSIPASPVAATALITAIEMLDGNHKGTYLTTQPQVRQMQKDGGGDNENIATEQVDHAMSGLPD